MQSIRIITIPDCKMLSSGTGPEPNTTSSLPEFCASISSSTEILLSSQGIPFSLQ